MPYIRYLPDECQIEVDEGESLLEASLQAGLAHPHVCGRSARCSTCRVLIVEGLEQCSERTAAEQVVSERLRFPDNIRLGCQTRIFGEVTVRRLALDSEDLDTIQDELLGRVMPDAVGAEKHVAILFADLRGFTTFSEALLPYDTIYVLNRYFRRMGAAIARHQGVINNYMGDGLMALFGLDDSEGAAEQAVRAGLAMLEALEQLNPQLETLYGQRLRLGIGIHYGCAVIGHVGAPGNQRLTAIGDAVNLAARIETANKRLGTSLLVSEATYQQVAPRIAGPPPVTVQLPGKSGEYRLYEVTAMQGPASLQAQPPQGRSLGARLRAWGRSLLARWWRRRGRRRP